MTGTSFCASVTVLDVREMRAATTNRKAVRGACVTRTLSRYQCCRLLTWPCTDGTYYLNRLLHVTELSRGTYEGQVDKPRAKTLGSSGRLMCADSRGSFVKNLCAFAVVTYSMARTFYRGWRRRLALVPLAAVPGSGSGLSCF